MVWFPYLGGMVLLILLAMLFWRQLDHHADRVAWNTLARANQHKQTFFSLDMIRDLPEPARRYYLFTITPGTPIHTAVRLKITGKIGRGTLSDHSYLPMEAEQILAPPHGLIWKVRAGQLSGSDGVMPDASWTRFWLFGVLPVVRAGGSDHHRSAFGRVIAEAAIWAPASLLPSDCVRWDTVDENTARAIVRGCNFEQAVDITVDERGAPTAYVIQRWSNENPERIYREQPFGGVGSDFRWFDGYRLPASVEGGNHFGTDAYFPFYKARVLTVDPV